MSFLGILELNILKNVRNVPASLNPHGVNDDAPLCALLRKSSLKIQLFFVIAVLKVCPPDKSSGSLLAFSHGRPMIIGTCVCEKQNPHFLDSIRRNKRSIRLSSKSAESLRMCWLKESLN